MTSEERHGLRDLHGYAGWRISLRQLLGAAGAGLFAVFSCGADLPSAPTTAVAAVSSAIPATYSGRLRVDYDYRSQGSAHDEDLYGYWSAGGRDLGNGYCDFHISGRAQSDLDGASPSESTFLSLDDAKGVIENRVQQAYLELHDRPGDRRLRLGRQYLDVADYIPLDGAQAILYENGPIGGRVFGGVPVSYYSSVNGDVYGGVSLAGRPWAGNRTRLTYSHYEDDSRRASDDNTFLDFQQQLADGVWSRGQASFLNNAFRMGGVDLSCIAPGAETSCFCGARRWGSATARTGVSSPLYELLGEQQPYTHGYVRMSYTLCPTLMISPGVSCQFADPGSADYSNRDYRDYDLTLTYEPNRLFSSSLSAQYWDVTGGDHFLGLSGEVRFRQAKSWDIGAGCAYASYTYSSYSDITYVFNGSGYDILNEGVVTRETPYTLTYFLRAKWYATRHLILRLQGDIEDDKAAADLGIRGRASAEVMF